jgi:hypothetical protein
MGFVANSSKAIQKELIVDRIDHSNLLCLAIYEVRQARGKREEDAHSF